MTENITMFKTNDIRTISENMTDAVVRALARSIAKYYLEDLGVKSVVLARDARLSCPGIMEVLMAELPRYGLDILVNPLQISTCQFYYTCMTLSGSGGIMITASHNPGSHIGMKLVGPDVFPISFGFGANGGMARIKEYYETDAEPSLTQSPGRVTIIQKSQEYIDYSIRLSGITKGDLQGLRIYFEFLNGTAGVDVALAMQRLGADCTYGHLVPDGLFPLGAPNPMLDSTMKSVRKAFRDGDYDIGFCYDGDGDRMDIMLSDGSQLMPTFNMVALLPYIRQIYRGSLSDFNVYADMRSAPEALKGMAEAGFGVHIIPNGHSFIKGKLRSRMGDGYVCCCEESAHYYLNFPKDADDISKGTVATENTLFFTLLTLKAFSRNRRLFQTLKEEQDRLSREREWVLNFNDPEAIPQMLDAIESHFKEAGAEIVETMDDGSPLDSTLIRMNFPADIGRDTIIPSGWLQICQRISNTEDDMIRFEIISDDSALCSWAYGFISDLTDRYIKEGKAYR